MSIPAPISIHAPARGASQAHTHRSSSCLLFQFTPLREGLRRSAVSLASSEHFNSRPCERGFARDSDHHQQYYLFQFTPLREGLLNALADSDDTTLISIHAPARGASITAVDTIKSMNSISIHAPARGASDRILISIRALQFQFTPLREGLQKKSPKSSKAEAFQFTPLREGLRERQIRRTL